MKAYLLMTGSGPIVVLTSHASMLDIALIAILARKGIDKFIAYEIPLHLAEQRYGTHFSVVGTHFSVVKGDFRETDDLRVLDEDGEHAFKLFRFSELGPAIVYEVPSDAK
jgi:hypothetical protein